MDLKNDLSQVTRADREVKDEGWIKDLLRRVATGVLATASFEDDGYPQPFMNTLLYVYDEDRQAIYLHSGRKGRVLRNIMANPKVCFTVSEMGRLLPANTALNFSVEYASVVVFGKVTVIEETEEAEHGLQLLLDKYFPQLASGRDYRPITAGEREMTAVYRIDISEWSGKKKEVGQDFPGAFRYSA